jgi:SAM-dependent methyltransferase
MVNLTAHSDTQGPGTPSPWIQRWTHLLKPQASVLDIACGYGRHMHWMAQQGHEVTGIDRAHEAVQAAAKFGTVIEADIENGPWPLMVDGVAQQFDAVIVTNYLWRALLPLMAQSVAPGGVLLYETFAQGNETVGKPSNPNFLLASAELLSAFEMLRVIAYEDGFLNEPPRFVQRIAAVRPDLPSQTGSAVQRYAL